MKNYCTFLLLFIVCWLIAIVSITASVDPYRLTGSELFGLSKEKTRVHTDGWRVNKSIDLRRKQYNAFTIGASRSLFGLHPHGFIKGKPAYNASFMAAQMAEQKKVFDYIIKYQNPEIIIASTGFVIFRGNEPLLNDFNRSGFAGRPLPLLLLQQIFSYSAISDSIHTILDNLSGKKASALVDGSLDGKPFYGPLAGTRQHVINTLTWQYFSHIGGYRAYQYDKSKLETLREMIRRAKERHIEFILYVAPVHALQLEAIRVAGLQDVYDEWKRDMATLATEEKITIYDFTTYNEYTTQDIFQSNPWFWEASHSKSALGDIILKQIVDGQEGPGKLLNANTVENILADQKREHDMYVNSHGEELRVLRRVFNGAEKIYGPIDQR